ncbi:MAG: AAA family ATPase [Xenococcaceae cyanobacterium]
MSQKIIINNFKPVSNFEAEITDIMLFIGTQASGKSTISKSIFFFKSIKDDLITFISEATPEDLNTPIHHFSANLVKKFLSCFGIPNHPLNLQYYYTSDKSIQISLPKPESQLKITFSDTILTELKNIFNEVNKYNSKILEHQQTYTSLSDRLRTASEKQAYLTVIEDYINTLFENNRTSVFIPAARSLLSTLIEQIQNIESRSLDFFTQSFLKTIQLLKPAFREELETQIESKRQLNNPENNLTEILKAVNIIKNILKGQYRFTTKDERLYFNEQDYIKLNYASSGQQEALWILLLIFKYILDKEQIFIVFEEPEAHLYPEAQNEIVQLMSLLANITQNQIIITTHSPYIISAFNNLLYAHQLGQNNPDIAHIVNPKMWLDVKRTSAYFIRGDSYESIIDSELNLIQAEKIDSASQIINETFDKLFDLDN